MRFIRQYEGSSFWWMAPRPRRRRLIAMLARHNISEVKDSYLAREIDPCMRRLTCEDGNVIGCLNELKHRQTRFLHNKIDRKPLGESLRVPSHHGYLDSRTMLLSGRSFILTEKLRNGGMPTNCQLQRDLQGEKNYRARCGVPETINYVVQLCFLTSNAKHARKYSNNPGIDSIKSKPVVAKKRQCPLVITSRGI